VKKAFIFDLDGTLLDSMGVWANFGSEYLRSKGIEQIPEQLRETLTPLSLLEAAEYFKVQFGFTEPAQQICEEINAMLVHQYEHELTLKEDALEFLQDHADHAMCIATATDRYLVEKALNRLGIARYFSFIITSSDVGNSKQNPDIFLEAAKRLGVDREDCIVFEDAPHAIRSASQAGFYVVGVFEKSFESELADIQSSAACFIQSLKEFPHD